MSWLASMPSQWELRSPKSLFKERRQLNLLDDVHLTPSQKYGVLPQAEYIERTGGSVVLNLTGQDRMKHVEANDFVIHLRSFQGGLERANQSGKVSAAYTVIEPKALAVPGYYGWLLKSSAFIQELQTTTNQLRDGQSIRWSDLIKVSLPMPPHSEQQAIADYLDRETQRIDELIAEQRGLIETLRERRNAVVADAVLGGTGSSPHEDWLSNIPAHWAATRVSRLGSLLTGGTPRGGAEITDGNETVVWIRPGDLGTADTRGVYISRESATELTAIPPGSTLVCCIGATLGKVGMSLSPVTTNQQITAWTHSLVPEYGYYTMLAAHDQLVSRATQNTLPILNNARFGELMVPVPPRDEQEEISEYLTDQTSRIHALITESEDLIALSQERRAALITAAVTGQIDVRKAA